MNFMDNKERVCIFIDGSNFYHSIRSSFDLHDSQIDFQKIIELLRKDRLLIGTHYYNAPLDRGYNKFIYGKQQKFFAELRKIPDFHIVLCNMRKTKRSDGTFEFAVKGDDIHIATDMLSSAYENKYDVAIIVSGDGDFVPVIKKVQKLGKKVENAYFSISRSDYLKNTCSASILLDESLIKKCLKEKE